jgi:hypothetical protein
MFKTNTTKGKQMNAYKFSGLPSNAAVTSFVTVLVTAWFALAGGAILTDHHSEANIEMARAVPASQTSVADVHETIIVEARRG